MPRTHKPYDASFRQQAVELLLTSGKNQRDVARDLESAIEQFFVTDNQILRPFVWTKSSDQILDHLPRCAAETVKLQRD